MSLSNWALVLGSLMAASGFVYILAPAWSRRAITAFPRSTVSAWILTAACLGWISYIVFHAALGRFDSWKPALYVLAPLSFFLLVRYLDDLLAPRALGGLLLLLPNPILNAARWHPSDWRLVMTVLAYIMVVEGILLVLGPYRFRRWIEKWLVNDQRCRARGMLKMAVGFCLIYLAVKVY